MRKHFYGSVLFLCILALCVSGCGGSGGSAADPMGTATVQFIDETGAVLYPEEGGGLFGFLINPGESRQLIVKVTNARSDGSTAPVVHEKVTFTLLTPQYGGRVTMVKEYTDSSGRAVGMYTAGNNFEMDNVRATTDAGASAECTVYKTGGLVGAVVALSANPSEVEPLGFSTITATVTSSGNPVKGQQVTFALTTSNGASLSETSGTTDASGQTTTTYQAGNNNSQDVVKATLSNGATGQVIITKSGVAPSQSITLSSSVGLPIAPGASSTMTATVKDSSGNLVSGETVRFYLSTSNGTINQTEVTTDGNGQASVLYTAGNSLNSDVLWASTSGGASTSLVITKTGQLSGYTATMTANPSTFTGDPAVIGPPPWTCNSILTVKVVDNNDTAAQGMRVRFSQSIGTTTPTNTLTGIDGEATVNFTGSLGLGTHIVSAYVDLDDDGVQDETDPTAETLITVEEE